MLMANGGSSGRLRVAVVGSGISGLAAAWLLSQRHDVTLYEAEARLGGHSNTVIADTPDVPVPVDTGFIVFNPKNYPNLTALFDHLGVETAASEMSFGVSLDDGAFEYGGGSLGSLLAQWSNVARPRFCFMLRDLLRFYRTAPAEMRGVADDITLGEFLTAHGYGSAFVDDHLLPMAGAIWSATPEALKSYPVAAFVRFYENHGLLQLKNRPQWRTVVGGSRNYVSRLAGSMRGEIRTGEPVLSITRTPQGVLVQTDRGSDRYDRALIATHADQALALLSDPSERERKTLSAFKYTRNTAVLHSDVRLMPKRRKVWSSWNYLGRRGVHESDIQVTYWMNRLQPLKTQHPLFVTLNPPREPASIHRTDVYAHPLFDVEALRAQKSLTSLQGQRNTWFCGAYFGSGFHEDGLKSGLDAAEAIGGVLRPWSARSTEPANRAMLAGADA